MIADERTNSLLIYASRDDMKTIKDIITKLDVVLAQVLIEAVVIEVDLNKTTQLGVSYLQNPNNPTQIGNAQGLGAIKNNAFLDKSAFSVVTNGATLLSGGFNYLATFDNDAFVATVTALANNSAARIMQRPRIQTSHNEPAHIFVGESRPYPTSSYYGGGAYGGYSSIQQLPIGVSLDVTPLINPDGLVVMEISQDIESVSGTVTIANVGDVPITSQKTATTKVSVRDRDTIMLGGLIENSTSKSYSGVPLLMDLPILGYLFRATTESKVRNELIVLIRPTVLPTPEVAALAAKTEKDRLPMIKRFEAEVQDQEAKRQKESNQELKGKKPQEP
jgi:general secretion pathway protein D